MNRNYVLAFDPSGNWFEGKGTTGWCLYDLKTNKVVKFGFISASAYVSQVRYWDAHIDLIDGLAGYKPILVIEGYRLYGDVATAQINSQLETPQLIGAIKYEAWQRGMPIITQTASEVKLRWKDETLIHKGVFEKDGNTIKLNGYPTSDHIRDAVRHAIHFATYKNKKKGDNYEGEYQD